MSKQPSKLGIISISSSVAPFPKRLKRSLDELENKGFSYTLGKHALQQDGYRVAHPREVANDVMDMFRNQSIAGILVSTGGIVGNNFLEFLDFNEIQKIYKPICGYSDATPLLLAVYAKTGQITFHGPTLLPSFGDFEGINPDTLASFLDIFVERKENIQLPDFQYMIASSQTWDVDDEVRLATKKVQGRLVVKAGHARGRLIGGNLNGVLSLLGTEYLPDFAGSVLFLEDSGSSLAQFERSMYQLKQAGILSSISGLIIGRFTNTFMKNVSSSQEVVRILLETVDRDIPILMDVACGHTKPQLTLPIGGVAEVKETGEIVVTQ